MKLLITLALAVFITGLSAQTRSGPVIVVGKVLSQKDSLLTREVFFEGLNEKLKENYQEASVLFNKVLEIDPANDAAMYELANFSMAQNKPTEAERLIRNAVTVKPDNSWYWSFLADIYKKTNNISELVLVLEELIRLRPGKEDHFYDRANAFMILKKTDQAIAAYSEIESKFGTSQDLTAAKQRILLQQGKPEKVEEELEKQIADNPDNIRNYLYLSEVYVKSGDRKKALEILSRAKNIEPANAMIRLALADNYKALKQFDNTFIELKVAFADPDLNIDEKVRIVLSFFPMFADVKARGFASELAAIMTKTHPDEAKAFAVYGDVLFQDKKYAEARDVYKKAVKLNDRIYQIWEQLIRIEVSLGDYQQAISDGEEALTIFPNQAELYLFTGIAYAQTKKHDKAVSYLTNAADLETEDKEVRAQIFSTLGDSYNALKKFKESDEAYEKSLVIDPDNSYVLNNYAYYLSIRGENLEKAEKMAKRSVQLDPNNASSEDTYAWILFKLKRYAEAKTWIEKALRNDTTNSSTQMEHYGDILYLLGERDLALQQWIKAKGKDPGSEILNRKINEKRYIE
ncbi:MAG: tetratricopeptide repeat protein [Daejeonella sp.]|uniref:tetratricopeptide repeat protein n=1 Tax=Daejeonella sp. TaxID=2805397 RepID=UPI003C77D34D